MKRNAVEWAVLAISVAAIAALVGVLVVTGLSESQPADPQVQLRVEESRPGALGWIVPATVSNGGDEAVQAVVLEATATVAGAEEVSELQVDHLPAGTEVEVSFGFRGQPEGEVTVRLVGFQVP